MTSGELVKIVHSLLCGSKAGRQKLRFSLLLNDAKTAGTEWNEPSIVTEGRDSNPGLLGGLENRLTLVDRYLSPIDRQFDLICHNFGQFHND